MPDADEVEKRFFASPRARRRRRILGAIVLAVAIGLILWNPFRPRDETAGRHPAAELLGAPAAQAFDPGVRRHGPLAVLSEGERGDPHRALLELTVVEPVNRVALVDGDGQTRWSADWPPPGQRYRFDAAPGLWQLEQERENLNALDGPLIPEREPLDLRAGEQWELRTTRAPRDGGR